MPIEHWNSLLNRSSAANHRYTKCACNAVDDTKEITPRKREKKKVKTMIKHRREKRIPNLVAVPVRSSFCISNALDLAFKDCKTKVNIDSSCDTTEYQTSLSKKRKREIML